MTFQHLDKVNKLKINYDTQVRINSEYVHYINLQDSTIYVQRQIINNGTKAMEAQKEISKECIEENKTYARIVKQLNQDIKKERAVKNGAIIAAILVPISILVLAIAI